MQNHRIPPSVVRQDENDDWLFLAALDAVESHRQPEPPQPPPIRSSSSVSTNVSTASSNQSLLSSMGFTSTRAPSAAVRPAAAAPPPPSISRPPSMPTTTKRPTVNPFTGKEKRALVQMPLPSADQPRPFDAEAAKVLEYPVNMARRDYQYSIVRNAVLRNTLVILPTSCGKTFIAAVVMANFFRWFPTSKVVFLAPTRPLIAQQFEACYSIMGVPQAEMAFMTGSVGRAARESLWQSRRLLFMTPQVLSNDIDKGVVDPRSISLVVVDEAHRARGHYAYCTALRDIRAATCQFRVLALSATPGSTISDVQEVLDNLFIAHIDIRQEHDIDVRQYMQKRVLDVQVVPSSVLIESLEQQLLAVMQMPLDQLRGMGAMHAGAEARTLTTMSVKVAQNSFRNRNASNGPRSGAALHAEGLFGLLAVLVAAHKTLGTHGPGMFANQLEKLINAEQQSRTKRALYETAQFRSLHIAAKRVAADPRANAKVNAMLDIVSAHFAAFDAAQSSTRVIVFTQWRDSVNEVVRELSERGGAIRPVAFVGQSDAKQGLTTVKGLNQREQSRIVREFRDGTLNVLVSTCIGEEGLDIGEVDLIVCFDVSSDSRALVQRMGRTGRKRNGRCVILCTDAERILYERNVHANRQIGETIVRRQSEAFKRYAHNERLLPAAPAIVERRFDPMPPITIPTAGSSMSGSSSTSRSRARKSASTVDQEAAGEAAIAEMVQWAGADVPRWNVKLAIVYNSDDAPRLHSRTAHSKASFALQRAAELTTLEIDDLDDLASTLSASSVGSRRVGAVDRRRMIVARIAAEDSDELLRPWNRPPSPRAAAAPPRDAVASTADVECTVLSLSDDDDDDDDDGATNDTSAPSLPDVLSFSDDDDDNSDDLFGGEDVYDDGNDDVQLEQQQQAAVVIPVAPMSTDLAPMTLVDDATPAPTVISRDIAANACGWIAPHLGSARFDPLVLPPPMFPPLSPLSEAVVIVKSASSVAASSPAIMAPPPVPPVAAVVAESFVPLSPPAARTPKRKSGAIASTTTTPYSSEVVRVRPRIGRVLGSPPIAEKAARVDVASPPSSERVAVQRKRLRKRRTSDAESLSSQPRALQPIPNRAMVAAATAKAFARHRLLDLDARDDDDGDEEGDEVDTDLASFIAGDDEEDDGGSDLSSMIANSDGVAPAGGLAMYRRAMISQVSPSATTTHEASGSVVDTDFEDISSAK